MKNVIKSYIDKCTKLVDLASFGFDIRNDDICSLVNYNYLFQMENNKRIFTVKENNNIKLLKTYILK